jgi:hypothetical protein
VTPGLVDVMKLVMVVQGLPKFEKTVSRRADAVRACRGSQPKSGTAAVGAGSCLTGSRAGRLDGATGRAFRSVTALYAVVDDQILLRLPEYKEFVHYAPGQRVTEEVHQTQECTDHLHTIHVAGTAQIIHVDQIPVPLEESWPEEVVATCRPAPPLNKMGVPAEEGVGDELGVVSYPSRQGPRPM